MYHGTARYQAVKNGHTFYGLREYLSFTTREKFELLDEVAWGTWMVSQPHCLTRKDRRRPHFRCGFSCHLSSRHRRRLNKFVRSLKYKLETDAAVIRKLQRQYG